jgi:Ser/Thr protein kinase RdoA (MazF antagonist)
MSAMSEYRSQHADVARQALRSYNVVPRRVGLAAESFNSVFRVTTTAAAVYALRVGCALQIHPEGTFAVEAAWLQRLRQQGVRVPEILVNVDGELATLVTDDRAEHGFRDCVLFEWVAGRSLRTCMTERRSAALGRLSARLHAGAEGWSPPGAGDVLLADRVLYWRLPDRLSAAGRFGFGTLFLDALARAQSALDWLWRNPPHPPHLVHGDLTPANVIVSPEDGLVPIDFQDTVRGFEVQDLSITVAALRRGPNGDRIVEAFRSGYAECRPWPDVSSALFESLIIARGLHQVNLTLNTRDIDGLEDYLAGHAERVRAWMRRPDSL